MKQKFIDLYSDIAFRVSDLSHGKRLKVGAVVVKDDKVISMGYNGTPSGWDNACEDKVYEYLENGSKKVYHATDKYSAEYPYREQINKGDLYNAYKLVTKQEVIHAEMNALLKLAKSTESANCADLFVTHSPCVECAKAIVQSGIKRVFYNENYRDSTGIDLLKKSNVEVIKR